MKTRAEPLHIDIVIGHPDEILDQNEYFGAIFQYPGTFGDIRDFSNHISSLHRNSAIAIMSADPLALTILKDPGSMNADIAVGSTQRFGVPVGLEVLMQPILLQKIFTKKSSWENSWSIN